MIKFLKLIIIALIIITAIVFIKYKPVYKVTISGEEIGYIENKESFEKLVNDEILCANDGNVAFANLEAVPEYSFTLTSAQTNEQQIFDELKETAVITYRYFAINVDETQTAFVDSKEEAEKAVEQLKQEYAEKLEEIDISVQEMYTQDLSSIGTVEVASALSTVENEVVAKVEEQIEIKSRTLDGIYFSSQPVAGNITSRYGANESIRDHTHKGLDIAAPNGTAIKAAAEGTVTYAGWMGGYGNLVIISHGNGIQTYYGHCSKLYVSNGQKVTAGTKIAAVGSTGNSTGNHLHFEIRKNGSQINPQKYVYK